MAGTTSTTRHQPPPRNEKADFSLIFFDAATGTSLVPNAVDLIFRADNDETLEVSLEKPPKGYIFTIKSGVQKGVEDVDSFLKRGDVSVEISGSTEVGCVRYVGSPVVLNRRHRGCSCGPIPMPLYKVQEFSTLRVRAYDLSFTDFVENAKAFLNGVGVLVTAVNVQSAEEDSAFRPTAQTFSAQTLNGVAEIYELPLHQLYTIEFTDPPGYVCESRGPQHRYICGDSPVEVEVFFRPCNQSPQWTLVFVRQDCPGVRWGGLRFEVNGQPRESNSEGVWSGLAGLTGTVQLSAPGKTLSPSSIDLSDNSPAVLQVLVAEKTQKQLTAQVVSQFLSDNGAPFANRRLTVLLPGAKPYSIYTDAQGFFQAPSGSTVEAHDDAMGLPAGPFLIS